MLKLKNKKILLAITGSIASYKIAFLIRLLIKNGAEVKVVMTPNATAFISPLTLSTLSKNPVYSSAIEGGTWNNHVALGLWADLMIVAPLTAATLGKMANGICDNMVLATYLSSKCPVFFAPAMDLDMWKHPSTQSNIRLLTSYGNIMIPVEIGELASGLTGAGRMSEPETIMQIIVSYLDRKLDFIGKKILITAGPTYEALDPVRFIGNHSSGKMGIAIANEFTKRGASVILILGPTNFTQKDVPNCRLIPVVSAQQMYEAAQENYSKMDCAIMSAAVVDYKPTEVARNKIKKKDENMFIPLEKTIDIAASLGKIKRKNQLNVGFALETNNEEFNAKSKLEKKNFDLIVLNSLRDKGAGFKHDTNKVTFIFRDLKIVKHNLKPKLEVAKDIADTINLLFSS